MKYKLILALGLSTFLIGCGGGSSSSNTSTAITTTDDTVLESIQRNIPSSFGTDYQNYFVKYISITAPNGKAINILAQENITDEKMLRAKNILEFYLTNYEGSSYGEDKDSVRNSMANNNATLLLLNGEDDGTNPASKLEGQPLFENEIQIEGGSWYTSQDYEHRDASYEEILHLVHDNGIGVDGVGGTDGALPQYQTEIRSAQANALSESIWTVDDTTMSEWTAENSLTQEYLASVVDAYYGLWGAWSPTGDEASNASKSMWGLYTPKVRADMSEKDPQGLALMENKFFQAYFTYNARIDSSFEGTFSLTFDESISYTHHSRYLKDITLLGSNNTNVRGNELDNNITGNSGENTVIFSGSSADYIISTLDSSGTVLNSVTADSISSLSDFDTITIEDQIASRDGKDTIKNVEKLQFSDKTITLEIN